MGLGKVVIALSVLALAESRTEAAGSAPIQTVSLNDLNMSAEGGEAKLFRDAKACRIEVVHYGEMGKVTYRFVFGETLAAAERKEFAYSAPPTADPDFRTTLRQSMTLTDPEGRTALSGDFQTYRALFDPRRIAACKSRIH